MKTTSLFASFVSAVLVAGCAMAPDDDTSQAQGALAATYVGCTFGSSTTYDADYCLRTGRLGSTAKFRLFTTTSPTYVKWDITDIHGNSRAGSDCTSVTCNAPIFPGETLYGHVLYYVVNGTPTQGAYAIAEYERDKICGAAALPCP